MGSFYRAAKPRTFVGIRRADLDPLLSAAGVLAALSPVLDFHTALEPLHVALRDQGVTDPLRTPPVLVLDAVAVQVDGGLNEVPRATCQLAVGRDAGLLAAGAPDAAAAAVTHVLESYLGRFVPARVYAHLTTTAAEGVRDLGDNAAWPDEWVVLFDGLTAGPTRRGTPQDASVVLHLVHFTAALTWSSSLSGLVAAGSEFPGAFAPGAFAATLTGVLGNAAMTPLGAVAMTLAGGEAAYTDFWGYNVPPSPANVRATGLKGFLVNLAGQQDLFDWAAFARADVGGAFCADVGRRRANDGALAALARVEPVWPLATTNTAPLAKAVWDATRNAVRAQQQAAYAAGTNRGVDRAHLIARLGQTGYHATGYRYGVPVSFWLSQQNLQPLVRVFGAALNPGRGFAADIVGATFGDLAPASFWELLAVRYASRYQIALAPMADRAVVVPFQPHLDGVWQTVYASEVDQWDDDMQTPLPVRGVVMVGDRRGLTGVMAGFDPGAPGAAAAMQQADAVYDSCEPGGVFVYRMLPPWLADAPRVPGAYFAVTVQSGRRAAAGVPWSTVPRALAAQDQLLAADPTLAAAAAAGIPGGGVAYNALMAASDLHRSTANRLAKAVYQQERTRPRTVYVRGRFRTDIGPGSVVRVELPADRYARAALPGTHDTVVTGVVTRVSLALDQEGQAATTGLQLGFVRTEGETARGHPLFAEGHPYWVCACYGVPWCDSVAMRAKLGARAWIDTSIQDLAAGNP